MDYLSCSYCGPNLIGKTAKRVQIGRVGRILVLEVTYLDLSPLLPDIRRDN